MSTETRGYDMSRHWRLVSNSDGLVTGTWWVTRPNRKGEQHVKPIDVVMWNEGKHSGVTLHLDDFTAFIKGGEVEPISARSHHSHIESEANARADEIAAVVLMVASAVEWPAEGDEVVTPTRRGDDRHERNALMAQAWDEGADHAYRSELRHDKSDNPYRLVTPPGKRGNDD